MFGFSYIQSKSVSTSYVDPMNIVPLVSEHSNEWIFLVSCGIGIMSKDDVVPFSIADIRI